MTSFLSNAMQIDCLLAAALVALILVAVFLRGRRRDAGRLGRYVLGEKLGEGAMGVVYRAQDPKRNSPVAIKVIQPERCDAESAARFTREVELTSVLTHPNTVRVLDHGRTADGVLYYVMECLEGASLADEVATSGAMPAERVLPILDQIAGALGEAHDRGLIHRDVKPANIVLVERDGQPDVPVLLDFGLVKQIGAASDGAPSLTHAGSCTGTPLYMAPEAITAPEEADGRTDLYALGAVGYFLLTGEHVFTGRTLFEICAHHLHSDPVAPSTRTSAPIPAALEALLLSCLAKDPADRPADAAAFRAALRACREDRDARDLVARAA